ncbi:MAG: hypothetical protein AB7G11_13900 [Phycisphaerales bacterium]
MSTRVCAGGVHRLAAAVRVRVQTALSPRLGQNVRKRDRRMDCSGVLARADH